MIVYRAPPPVFHQLLYPLSLLFFLIGWQSDCSNLLRRSHGVLVTSDRLVKFATLEARARSPRMRKSPFSTLALGLDMYPSRGAPRMQGCRLAILFP
eukprot:1230615-Pleurochrysis_carterae.AAC.2